MKNFEPDYNKQIFDRISGGDEKAFSECYEEYRRLLYPFLFKLTKSASATEDLIQDTMLKVWLSRDKFSEIGNPRAWIFRIASNTAHNWLKNSLIRQNSTTPLHYKEDQEDHSSEVFLELKAIREIVQEAIAELPPQRKKVYLLNREQGLTVSEIAQKLNISPSTAKNTLLAAVKYIREKVERSGYGLANIFLIFFQLN
ncbi:MAG TPA: RNA polymerase sigma factor [Parasegetibacter sp.]|jgi:RNA polymerase sigma-70 factor (family 1)